MFQGAGLTGRRGNLIADSVQYVLNVVLTSMRSLSGVRHSIADFLLVPAIIYIDKWGRRPMLLIGLAFMGFWLFLVGGLQARFGAWGTVDNARKLLHQSVCEFYLKKN